MLGQAGLEEESVRVARGLGAGRAGKELVSLSRAPGWGMGRGVPTGSGWGRGAKITLNEAQEGGEEKEGWEPGGYDLRLGF